MRNRFDRELVQLNDELIEMGSLIEKAIEMAVTALVKQDAELAQKTIAMDTEIDNQERTIENLCLKLLLQQQPVAKDLRVISAALKMITDMERIGDHAIRYFGDHDPAGGSAAYETGEPVNRDLIKEMAKEATVHARQERGGVRADKDMDAGTLRSSAGDDRGG